LAEQHSLHEKTRADTQGNFASAWIDHGTAPQQDTYEYLVCIQPTDEELKELTTKQTYQVVQCNQQAHIVTDRLSGITGFALFEALCPTNSDLFLSLPAETLIMHRNEGNRIHISICDPNLNIREKAYTTKEPSRIIQKQLTLKGKWMLENSSNRVNTTEKDGNTILTVLCQHGQPVIFSLNRISK